MKIEIVIRENDGVTHDELEDQVFDALRKAQAEGNLKGFLVKVETEME